MKKKGRGIGIMFYGTGYGNGFPDVSKAVAELQRDGKISIYVGACEVGQGAKTALSQIAAEVLGVTIEEINLVHEDTKTTPDAGTCAASRQTYNMGNAIKKAAEKLREEMCKIGMEVLKLNTDVGLLLKDGSLYVKSFPKKNVSFAEISKTLKNTLLRVEAEFTAQTTEMDEETGQGAPYWPYTFAACGVEVEVDTDSGLVEVTDAVFAEDVGKAINPHLIEGQMDGGFAMALGYALFEDAKVEKGSIRNNSFTKYLIPTALDMPDIDKIIVEDPESTAPYGAKGIGEPVMIPVAPAILNAIYDAVGVRMTDIPVTAEKLMKALNKKGQKAV